MSAPSKEEIAALVRVVAFQCGSGEAAQVADLADENERLRADERALRMRLAQLEEACQAFENSSALANKAADEAEAETKLLRSDLAAMTASFDEAAGHLTRLMDERAECLSLLEDAGGYQSLDYCDDDPDDLGEDCADIYDDNKTPCWSHRLAVMVAKLRSAP